MSKCKYQKGDTVRIVRQGKRGSKVSWCPPMEDYNGKYAVITDCCSELATPAYSLDIDDGKWLWGEDCLVCVGEWDYTYNVGDKVRIVKQGEQGSKLPWNCDGDMDEFSGRVATIVSRVGKFGITDIPCYKLDIDNGEWMWGDDCLEAVDTTEESINPLIETLIEEEKDEETFVINPPYVELDAIALEQPQTTIYWSNGDTTTVTCHDEDDFDWEKGIALAVMKYAFGNDSSFNNIFHKARRYMNKREYEMALDNLLEEFAEKLQALEDEYK